MTGVGGTATPITKEKSEEMGISATANKELQGFLKDRTKGTAAAIIRSNKTGIGLESWRMLSSQFNPRTLTSTMHAQHLETHPKGASTIKEMPAALLEWEKNLRRCLQEGRTAPNDETKRLALCACCLKLKGPPSGIQQTSCILHSLNYLQKFRRWSKTI